MAATDIHSEIAGTVWKVEVAEGETVAEDAAIIILESMKMEIPILAPIGGVVRELAVAEGEPVAEGQLVAVVDGR